MQAQLHPLELGEDVVGQVEATVAADVALAAAEDAERRQLFVRRLDLLGLAPNRVAVEPRHRADSGRVIADCEVLVAATLRGLAQLEHARLAVRPRRVHVQVAADLRELDERRRLGAERRLAKLRRAERDAEPRVDAGFVGRVRQRLERVDVLR